MGLALANFSPASMSQTKSLGLGKARIASDEYDFHCHWPAKGWMCKATYCYNWFFSCTINFSSAQGSQIYQLHPPAFSSETGISSPSHLVIYLGPLCYRKIKLSQSPPLPVISSGLISASNSNVMRVTSLLGELRARRPLPFLEESHFRFTNVTWQSEQGAAPPSRDGIASISSKQLLLGIQTSVGT